MRLVQTFLEVVYKLRRIHVLRKICRRRLGFTDFSGKTTQAAILLKLLVVTAAAGAPAAEVTVR